MHGGMMYNIIHAETPAADAATRNGRPDSGFIPVRGSDMEPMMASTAPMVILYMPTFSI